jgi:hypothetical protein
MQVVALSLALFDTLVDLLSSLRAETLAEQLTPRVALQLQNELRGFAPSFALAQKDGLLDRRFDLLLLFRRKLRQSLTPV